MFAFTIPASEPEGPTHFMIFPIFFVKIALESPYGTELLIFIASSNVLNLIIYNIGTNNSSLTIGAFGSISTIVGST